ncbi:MAG: hypothetical protein EBR09_10945 [Proteobacteria bacterium]|nr:hypothetical protein [Pseudomonadota bacterium]
MRLSTVLFAAAVVTAMSACTDGSTFIEGTRAKPAPAVVKANPSGDVSKKSASSENSSAPVNQGSNQLPAPAGQSLPNPLPSFNFPSFPLPVPAKNPEVPLVETPASKELENLVPQAECPMYANTRSTLYCVRGVEIQSIGMFNLRGESTPLITDIAISLTGKIYAVSPSALYLVNPSTAEIFKLIDVSIANINALTVLSDGRLVIAGRGAAIVNVEQRQIVPIPSTAGYDSSGDIVGLPDKKLYWSVTSASGDQLMVIDVTGGTTTLAGPLMTSGVLGLAYAAGVLYGFRQDGAYFSIDPRSGAASQPLRKDNISWWGATTNPVKW